MSRFLDLHRVAQRDLDECAEYIRQNNPRSALRFLRAARITMERLLTMPEMGNLYESDEPELAGVRFFPVTRYRNYLVFYLPLPASRFYECSTARGTSNAFWVERINLVEQKSRGRQGLVPVRLARRSRAAFASCVSRASDAPFASVSRT
jgi:plasmid stabilization system protein ParE